LERSRWAGAVDAVGGSTLAYLLRTMNYGGSIALSGNAGGVAFIRNAQKKGDGRLQPTALFLDKGKTKNEVATKPQRFRRMQVMRWRKV
jgi:NADPH:quinone reductase-like Zn-dependent oxidoreductase